MAAVVIASLLLSACAEDDAPDFCKNHALFHAEHADASAQLTVAIAEGGQVGAELYLPNASASTTSADLSEAANVFALESEQACEFTSGELGIEQDGLRWTYATDCGTDNKLGQINVLLFDVAPDLNEVLVHVTTHVTEKHFAIHRQCSSAIFRLE